MMNTQTVQIQNAAGLTLAAKLDQPDTAFKATAMFAHCFTCSKDILAASQLPETKAFVTIGSPSDPQHIFKLIGEQSLQEIEAQGDAQVTLEGRVFRIKKQFLTDAAEQRVLDQVRRLGKPLLIMHSPVDTTVPIEHATALFHAAHHPKSFISLDQADHLLTRPEDAAFVADVVARWSQHYIQYAHG